jgi:alpha-beta hydrolase superfamily lysophospholipase
LAISQPYDFRLGAVRLSLRKREGAAPGCVTIGTMNLPRLAVLLLLVVTRAVAAPPSGWKFKAGEKGKPAVLLIHGLAASRGHWTSPADTWSIKNGHYKHWKSPRKQDGHSTFPKVPGGVRSVVLSAVDKHADEEGSFWNSLVAQGFTVATWNQIPCMDTSDTPSQKCLDSDVFDAAYPSAKEALAYLATQTTEDIALVAHSRGGLIARKLLKEKDADLPAITRVKWVITLHTPHHGSSMASKGNAFQKAISDPSDAIELGWVPKALRDAAKKLLPDAGKKLGKTVDVLVVLTGLAGAKELDANGKLYKDLEAGEKKRPGLKFFTFGGTSPRLAKVWARVYSEGGRNWKTEPRELLDFPGDMKVPFDEVKKGGDLLVTDASSKLASLEDQHFTNALNHAEVLWNKKVQKKVAALLLTAPAEEGSAAAGEDDQEDDADDDSGNDDAADAGVP